VPERDAPSSRRHESPNRTQHRYHQPMTSPYSPGTARVLRGAAATLLLPSFAGRLPASEPMLSEKARRVAEGAEIRKRSG
jgi:hypothetical protein